MSYMIYYPLLFRMEYYKILVFFFFFLRGGIKVGICSDKSGSKAEMKVVFLIVQPPWSHEVGGGGGRGACVTHF